MQPRSSTPVFDLWGEVPRAEHATISYREPQLSELIAASVVAHAVAERPSQTRIDLVPPAGVSVETTAVLESFDRESLADVPIEATVVISASRTVPCSTPTSGVMALPAPALGQARVRSGSTSTLSPFVIERASPGLGSMPSMSYSVPDTTLEEPEPLPLVTRLAYAISIAVVGIFCGIVGATSILHVSAAGGHVVRRSEPRISVDDRIPAVAVIRDKAVVRSAVKSRGH